MPTTNVTFAPLTGTTELDALFYGTRWGDGAGAILSYSFPGFSSLWDANAYGVPGEPNQGFAAFGGAEQVAVRAALAAWSSVANVSFVEVGDSGASAGTLRFSYTTWDMSSTQFAYAYAPDAAASGGDVWLSAAQSGSAFTQLGAGEFGSFVIMHEIGHALGLKHPHEISGYSSATLGALQDSLFNTVMSYFAWPGIALTATNMDRLPTTPMALDIDALQALYGANATSHAGDDHYVFASGSKYLQTIYDTGGNDTIELTGTDGGEIDLRLDEWSRLGLPVVINDTIQNPDTVRIYRTTVIENAIGGDGNDTLIGNDAANALSGNGGNDLLRGGGGPDTLSGGAGADVFQLDAGAQDFITDFTVGDQLDLALLIAHFTALPADANPFALAYLQLVQQDLNALLQYDTDGSGGADGWHAAAALASADIDDLGPASFVQHYDPAAQGAPGASLTGTENADSITGTVDDDTISGLGGNDTLRGGLGNDTLDGGAGVDIMVGGTGDDTYSVDIGNDVCSELAGEGTDSVNSSSPGYDIQNNVENLNLLGAAVRGGGNASDNVITGNGGDNLLVGRLSNDTLYGGAGADHLDGGQGDDSLYGEDGADRLDGNSGNDTLDGGTGVDAMFGDIGNDAYVVDNAGDVSSESSAFGGTDTVYSLANYDIQNNIENLTLQGSANIRGGGNTLDNTILGNSGNNVLQGRGGNDVLDGGVGGDTMVGGTGNDTFYVDQTNDIASESVGEGADTVFSLANYDIQNNIENLTLQGGANIRGGGNTLDNTILGNSGNNFLQGRAGADTLAGGAGADTLNGGAGADKFVFADLSNDTIQDFELAVDDIVLDNAFFTQLGPDGALDAARFYSAAGASQGLDGDDYLVYDQASGALYYDADGAGGASGLQLATLVGSPDALTHSDFSIA